MKHTTRIATFIFALLMQRSAQLEANQPLAMTVTPAVALAPAFISVRITIESNAENRGLEVITDSPDFFRSSQIQLDGERAPRTSVLNFPNLPTGKYEVTSILVGSRGRRAMVSQRV